MTPQPTAQPADLVAFWHNAGPDRWFEKNPDFDALCRTRFLDLHLHAAARRLEHWLATADGTLALILLVDQIPRNIFRGTPHMYATDTLARHYASHAHAAGRLNEVAPDLRVFLCLPFSHSENLDDQARAIRLADGLGDKPRAHALRHHDIIRRFARFPHRNEILARDTTADEAAYLADGGFAG